MSANLDSQHHHSQLKDGMNEAEESDVEYLESVVFETISSDERLSERISLYDLRAERQAVKSIDRTFPYSLFKSRKK